jgi:hypothetical protein
MPFIHFDGNGDQPLHFLGGMPGPLGDDLDDGRRQIGIGIHGQALQRANARADQHERHHADEKALAQRRRDDPVHDRRRTRRHGRQFVGHCALHELNEEAAIDHDPSPPGRLRECRRDRRRECRASHARAQTAIALRDIDEGQVFIVAQDCGNRREQPRVFLAGLNRTWTYICFFRSPAGLSTVTRTFTERVLGSTRAGCWSPFPRLCLRRCRFRSRRCRRHCDDAISESNTCASTQTREISATVKHGVVPACSSSPGVISFSTTVPAIGARMVPSICASARPRSTSLRSCGSILSDASAAARRSGRPRR